MAEIDLTEQQLAGYRHLRCRDLKHAWEPVGYFRGPTGTHRELECLRCGTVRTDRWNYGGVSRSYDYPDDYRLDGAVDSSAIRKAVLEAATVYETAEDMHAHARRRKAAAGRRRASR